MKVDLVSTWCISGFCLSCGGFGLVDVWCMQILVSPSILFLSAVALSFNVQCRLFDGDFFCGRGVFNWAGSCAYRKLSSHYCFVCHLTSILRGHQLVLSQAHYNQQVPFHSQNNHSPHHTCPKASRVLVLPGCGKSLFHRGVGRQMRDCTPG